jgi:biotin synthase
LVRLLNPRINIPSTTALATIDPAQGRRFGLERGANIVMPNLTPAPYRGYYDIYPGKAGSLENADESHTKIVEGILAMGRTIGYGRGDSREFRRVASTTPEEAII